MMYDFPVKTALVCEDEQQFESVWARVMGNQESAIVVGRASTEGREGMISGLVPSSVTVTKTCEQGETVLPCFGDLSCRGFLEYALSQSALAVERFCQVERQVSGKWKGTVRELVEARKKEMNQLETAYFLLTGLEAPNKSLDTLEYHHPVSVSAGLRTCFQEAQKWQGLYQKAAFQTKDHCLTTLFLQLEQERKEEVAQVKQLVEALFWAKSCGKGH